MSAWGSGLATGLAFAAWGRWMIAGAIEGKPSGDLLWFCCGMSAVAIGLFMMAGHRAERLREDV